MIPGVGRSGTVLHQTKPWISFNVVLHNRMLVEALCSTLHYTAVYTTLPRGTLKLLCTMNDEYGKLAAPSIPLLHTGPPPCPPPHAAWTAACHTPPRTTPWSHETGQDKTREEMWLWLLVTPGSWPILQPHNTTKLPRPGTTPPPWHSPDHPCSNVAFIRSMAKAARLANWRKDQQKSFRTQGSSNCQT